MAALASIADERIRGGDATMMVSEVEAAPREHLEVLQLERLRAVVDRVLTAVPFGRERLHGAGVHRAEDIASLLDLRCLPFTVKSDLREHYPFGLLAVPRERLVRVHASSGSRGRPTVVGYTRRDLDVWTDVMARCMAMAGVRPGTMVHNAYGYGLFTGGLGVQQGAERLGATVVPVSAGNPARGAMLLRDLGAQVLSCTPSYALRIAEDLGHAGVRADDLALEVGVFGGEPWTASLRQHIERLLGLTALNIYGLSEIVGPGVAAECRDGRNGMHVQEDHFLVEVIDPETGQAVEPGQEGELVVTTLTKEALPLLRYRTGDIASLTLAPCPCGRTQARMSTVRGRRDDVLVVGSASVYPSEIEHALLSVDGIAPHYQLIVEPRGEVILHCEPVDDGIDRAGLQTRVHQVLRRDIGITIAVELLQPGRVPRSEGKAIRLVDRSMSSEHEPRSLYVR